MSSHTHSLSGPSSRPETVRFMSEHEVRYRVGEVAHIDLGRTLSVGFRIDVWIHTFAGDADDAERAPRCRRLYDFVRRVVREALSDVDALSNAILWVEPWDGHVARTAAQSIELPIRIEVDGLVTASDEPLEVRTNALTRDVMDALARQGLSPR